MDSRRRDTVSGMSMGTAVEVLTSVPTKTRRGSLENINADSNQKAQEPHNLRRTNTIKKSLSLSKSFKKKKEHKDAKVYKLALEKGDLSTIKLTKFKGAIAACNEEALKALMGDGVVMKFCIRTVNTIIANKSNVNIEKVVASLECLYTIASFPCGISYLNSFMTLKQLFEAFQTGIPDVVDSLSRIFSLLCKSNAENHDKITQLLVEFAKKKNEAILNPFATMIRLLSQNYDKQLASVIALTNDYLMNIENVEYRVSCENELLNEIGLLPVITDLKNRASAQVLDQIEILQNLVISDYNSTLVELEEENEEYQENRNTIYDNNNDDNNNDNTFEDNYNNNIVDQNNNIADYQENYENYEGENEEYYNGEYVQDLKDASFELAEDHFSILLFFGLDKGYQYYNYQAGTCFKDLKHYLHHLQDSLHITHSFSLSEFGLFIDNATNNFTTENDENGFWLDEELTCGDYHFSGPIVVMYKLRPWNLLINIPSINDELLAADLEADPHSTITEVISTVVSAFEFDQSEEYQLFYHQLDLYLDPTHLLLTYPVDEKSTFSLKMKRPPLNIKFKEKTFSLDFDYNSSVGELQTEICNKMGIPAEQHEYYGIFIDSPLIDPPPDPTPDHNLLEESLIIDTLWQNYSDNFSLHFSRKPDWLYVYVVYPPPDPPMQFDIRVFLDRPVFDGLVIVCKLLQIDPAVHQLFVQTEDGKNIPLSSEKTFIQQSIVPEQQLIIAGKTDQVDEADVSIWEEERNEQTFRYKMEGNKMIILCGTLNQLVNRLTDHITHDMGFIKTFIATYRSFSTPTQLLEKIFQRYEVPDWVPKEERNLIQMRVCVVLKLWVENCSDESERELFDLLNEFVERALPNGPATVKGIKSAISISRKKLKRDYYFQTDPPPARVPKLQSSNTISDLMLTDIDPLEIARQLTKLEFEMFSKITAVELFGQAWSNPKKQHLCPNLLKVINNFNYISRWVGSAIVSEKKIKQRARIFQHLIAVAENLRAISSFNLLTAMISGFNGSAIGRLSYTKSRLPKRSLQVLESLEKLTNMENSYKNYRTAISSIQPPLIPYIGVYLQDLTFIEDGNPDYIDGLINFTKRSLVYKILQQIAVFQVEAYNFHTVPLLCAYLTNLPQMNDKEMYAMSLLIEPRNAKRSEIE